MAPEAVTPDSVLQRPAQTDVGTFQVQQKRTLDKESSTRPSRIPHPISLPKVQQSYKSYLANLRSTEKGGDSSLQRGFRRYASKWTGANEGLYPPRPTLKVLFWSWIAAFCGIVLLAALTYNVPWYAPTKAILDEDVRTHLVFIIGSFGASAVLVFGTVDSPLAQPRNLIGGHVLSASIGVAIAEAFAAGGLAYSQDQNKLVWLQAGLAVATAIVAMQLTRTVHPPGGATALIAVTSPPTLRLKGFFIIIPVLSGALLLLLVALIVNNFQRQYPLYWWSPDVLNVPMEDPTHHTGSGEAFSARATHSFVGGSLHGSFRGGSLHGSFRGGDSTHHSRVSFIDLSTEGGGNSIHGKRPKGEAYAPVRHQIISFPSNLLQAESALAGGGPIIDVVLDRPNFGMKTSGNKLVLPDRGQEVPPMKRVEGWVENDAKGAIDNSRMLVDEEQGRHAFGNQQETPSKRPGLDAGAIHEVLPGSEEGQVHGANAVLASALAGDSSAAMLGEA